MSREGKAEICWAGGAEGMDDDDVRWAVDGVLVELTVELEIGRASTPQLILPWHRRAADRSSMLCRIVGLFLGAVGSTVAAESEADEISIYSFKEEQLF
jgi:hypothetical protein